MFSHQAMQSGGGHFSTDFHMLDFDGFEGLKDIEQGFELHDIKSEMTGNSIESSSPIGCDGIRSIAPNPMTPLVDQTITCNNEIIQQERNNNVQMRKKKKDEEQSQAPSKKIRWSGPLHTRFLKAASIIGLQKLTPKKVLKLMNVPGLTRRNVASHLQKYRLFLKRFADKNYPDMKDRERALDIAFLKTMPTLYTRQRSSDISIPCPLSFFRTLIEWKRASFSDYIDEFPEPVYVHPPVPSGASNCGSTTESNLGTHSNGVMLPPTRFMQNHHHNVSCGPRNNATPFNLSPNNNGNTKYEHVYVHPSVPSAASNRGSTSKSAPGTHSNGAALPPTRFVQNHPQNVSYGTRNHATPFNLNPNNNGYTKSEPVYVHPSVPSAASNRGSTNNLALNTPFSGAVLPPTRFMHNHHENVSCGPRNHATPFNSNLSNNGMMNFHNPPQVNGNAAVFGSDQGKLGGQGIYKLNEFEISCFDTASGATVVSDRIKIPSTETGQENFSSNVTQEEQPFGSFSAMNDPPAAFGRNNSPSCQQVNNMKPLIPQQGLGDASVLGTVSVPPPQSLPSNDLFDDEEMWTDEFMASLIEDIRPLLED